MIDDVDEAVRSLIREEALNGTAIDVVFDAPTKEWSSRRNSPTLDVYLYDIREDLRRRETGVIDVHGEDGRITGRRRPPRHFKLSYLVTAWTQRPEDEHRLLSAVLSCFVRHDKLPAAVLQGSLAAQALPVPVTVALPPPEDRALSDVWSAMGGELKPSLDLVVTLPVDTLTFVPAATLITEQPRLSVTSAGGAVEVTQGRGQPSRRPSGSQVPADLAPDVSGGASAGVKGTARRPKTKASVASAAAAAAASASATAAPASATAAAAAPATETAAGVAAEKAAEGAVGAAGAAGGPGAAAGGPGAAGGAPAASETVAAGSEDHPGRIFHWRNIAEP